MKTKVSLVARMLLGLIYFVFGLNGFLNFIPPPAEIPASAVAFYSGMASAPYFTPVLKGTEVIGGLLLLTGFAAPLGLIILAPITLQIFLFHAYLTPGLSNMVMPVAMVVLQGLAAWGFWYMYRPLFSRAKF